MTASVFRPLALGLLYLAIVSCSNKETVTPAQPGAAREAATGLNIQCDVNQGFNFNPSQHKTLGYITSLTIGGKSLKSDIQGAGISTESTESAIIPKRAVGVLTSANWSTLSNENITFNGRISEANAQTLKALTLPSGPKGKPAVSISFAVFDYDQASGQYFMRFSSSLNTNSDTPINALLGKSSAGTWGLTVGSEEAGDPAGIRNYALELILAPPTALATQQILIKNTYTIKLLKPWGIVGPVLQ